MDFKNLELLFLVVHLTKIIYSLNMDDVCSADDDKCKKPNRYDRKRQNWKLCDLVMSDDGGNEIADDPNCIRSNITTWQKLLAEKSADHDCEEGKQCEINPLDNSVKCVAAYCKGLPNTPNAEVDERFGLRRNLDTGNKYKCDKGYKMEGNPFAVCQSPGEWQVLFCCTTKVAVCSAEGYQYDYTTKTCINLVKDHKSNWEDARKSCQNQTGGDLVSITTKEKWEVINTYLEDADVENKKVWIGLKTNKWVNRDIFTVVNGIIFKFTDDKQCGIIQNSKLKSHNCQSDDMFLCEIRKS